MTSGYPPCAVTRDWCELVATGLYGTDERGVGDTTTLQTPCRFLLLLCYSTCGYQLDRGLRARQDTRPELPEWTEAKRKEGLGRTS